MRPEVRTLSVDGRVVTYTVTEAVAGRSPGWRCPKQCGLHDLDVTVNKDNRDLPGEHRCVFSRGHAGPCEFGGKCGKA
ncbi:MAG: hypothetical protein L3K18_09630 [Thermoplasmata archaeon]|nr:hypothetical protein [Thermoplasmata archaeon]